MSNKGFVAGTLVHTNKGMRPIQDIKVGDKVLSSPEQVDGSVRKYKRVVNTFRNESEKVYELLYRYYLEPEDEDESGLYIQEHIYLTDSHPIFVTNSFEKPQNSGNWIAAGELSLEDEFILCNKAYPNGAVAEFFGLQPVLHFEENTGFTLDWRDEIPHSTIIQFSHNSYDAFGIELSNMLPPLDLFETKGIYRDFNEDTDLGIADRVRQHFVGKSDISLPTFNIEVEDYHTYFVGEQGLWVHNDAEFIGIELIPSKRRLGF